MVKVDNPSERSLDSNPRKCGCCTRLHGVRKSKCNQIRNWFKKSSNIQLVLMMVAVLLGILIGCVVKTTVPSVSHRTATLVGFPGELLMNMLKMLIIPLIVSTLISGIANLDLKSCGKMGMWTLTYFVITTLIAVVLGILLVVAIHPGNSSIRTTPPESDELAVQGTGTLDAILDLVRNMVPPNIIQACMQQIQSQIVNKTVNEKVVKNNQTQYSVRTEEVIEINFVDSTNVLGLVTFSLAIGLCLAQMGEQGRPLTNFFMAVEEVIMRLVHVIMWYAPIGMLFIITSEIISIQNFADIARGLGMYILTVTLGLSIHLFFVLALSYFAITRKNPYKFLRGMLGAFFTALGTGSSAATLPITFRCLEEGLKIDKRVTRFVLPVGSTMNMNGTALYEAVAAIFIAQVNDYDLSIIQLVTVSLTATMAAIGAAGVPHAGLVTLVLVVTSVGLPVHDITLILAVDWIIDRLRTSVNVMGDSYGAGIVAHLCRKQFNQTDFCPKENGHTEVNQKVKSQESQDLEHLRWNMEELADDLETDLKTNF